MKIKSIIATAGATVLLSTPMLAGAAATPASTPAGFDSCVRAFVASLSSKIGSAPKLREAHYLNPDEDDSRLSELLMTARDPRDNHVVWKSTCYVNARGEVSGLEDRSLRDL